MGPKSKRKSADIKKKKKTGKEGKLKNGRLHGRTLSAMPLSSSSKKKKAALIITSKKKRQKETNDASERALKKTKSVEVKSSKKQRQHTKKPSLGNSASVVIHDIDIDDDDDEKRKEDFVYVGDLAKIWDFFVDSHGVAPKDGDELQTFAMGDARIKALSNEIKAKHGDL